MCCIYVTKLEIGAFVGISYMRSLIFMKVLETYVASATPQPDLVVIGNNAILEITLLNGTIKQYDLTAGEIQDFLTWYDNRSDGIGKAYYTFINKGIVSPFLNKGEFIPFDKILYIVVNEYAAG